MTCLVVSVETVGEGSEVRVRVILLCSQEGCLRLLTLFPHLCSHLSPSGDLNLQLQSTRRRN